MLVSDFTHNSSAPGSLSSRLQLLLEGCDQYKSNELQHLGNAGNFILRQGGKNEKNWKDALSWRV